MTDAYLRSRGIDTSIPGVAPAKTSGSWIDRIIGAGEGAVTGALSSVENWFVRGMLIALAIAVIGIALWKAAGEPTLPAAP